MTPVEAGAKGALIQDSVAIASTVARRTDAGVVVDSVLAGATVEAGVAGTLIDVDFAALAGKSCTAATHPQSTVDQTQATYRRGERDGWYQQIQLTLADKTTGTATSRHFKIRKKHDLHKPSPEAPSVQTSPSNPQRDHSTVYCSPNTDQSQSPPCLHEDRN